MLDLTYVTPDVVTYMLESLRRFSEETNTFYHHHGHIDDDMVSIFEKHEKLEHVSLDVVAALKFFVDLFTQRPDLLNESYKNGIVADVFYDVLFKDIVKNENLDDHIEITRELIHAENNEHCLRKMDLKFTIKLYDLMKANGYFNK